MFEIYTFFSKIRPKFASMVDELNISLKPIFKSAIYRMLQDRRDLFMDAMVTLAKREKEQRKNLRKRNTKRLTDILDRMTGIKYNTTWEQVGEF